MHLAQSGFSNIGSGKKKSLWSSCTAGDARKGRLYRMFLPVSLADKEKTRCIYARNSRIASGSWGLQNFRRILTTMVGGVICMRCESRHRRLWDVGERK